MQKLFNSSEKEIILNCPQTKLSDLTQHLKAYLKEGDWIFLEGDLGTGKTTFAKELINQFDSHLSSTSPTFSILNSQKLTVPQGKVEKILHIDLYRMKSGKELLYLGLDQEFHRQTTLAIFEWPSVVEEEEWSQFFEITRCEKPNRILQIEISMEEEERQYKISFVYEITSGLE